VEKPGSDDFHQSRECERAVLAANKPIVCARLFAQLEKDLYGIEEILKAHERE
jgi:hypothetical protein